MRSSISPTGPANEPPSRSGFARCASSSLDALRRVLRRIPERGGIVEERVGVGAQEVRSPSVQLRVTPLGKVELLSTHDQMLGGPERPELSRLHLSGRSRLRRGDHARGGQGGELLRDAGVIGRFAIDFVVTRARNPRRGKRMRSK